jgi:radical SAM superfamily enzyme YgiQ (UPF0313 family)
MKVAGRKALQPPLGLLTIAAMLPSDWRLRLVDCNVRELREEDWSFADTVMISAMLVQQEDTLSIAAEAKRRGKLVVAGGPYPTSAPQELLAAGCDYVVSGEGENAIGDLLDAMERKAPPAVFEASTRPDMKDPLLPRFDLADADAYDAWPVQTARGCPFACEFCDIISLFGRIPRYKPPQKTLEELEALYQLGRRGMVFISDDNFIGNLSHAKALLELLIPWNKERGEPFWFITQASINLGQNPELIDLMTEANIGYVFIGIESPDSDVLSMMHKKQNLSHPLLDSLRTIQEKGLTVIGSFILGFDNERAGAGARIQSFVEAANIPLVMVNILQALPNTALWDRLKSEGRLQEGAVGDVATGMMNFTPSRPARDIVVEQLEAWEYLYDPSRFMARVLRNIRSMRPTRASQGSQRKDARKVKSKAARNAQPLHRGIGKELRAMIYVFGGLGVLSRHRMQFWKQLIAAYRENPSRWFRYVSLLGMGADIMSFVRVVKERSGLALKRL